jgi:hypothetical protein
VGVLLLLVGAASGVRKHFGGSPRFQWVLSAQGPPLRRRSEPRLLHHQRHVKARSSALGMRAFTLLSRSSRQVLPRKNHSAAYLHLHRPCSSNARHAICPSMRPLSHGQHRHYHARFDEPTIYALSTASGKAAIAVIRISGPACRQVQLIHIRSACNLLMRNRFIKACAHPLPFQNLDTPPFASSTAPICRPRQRPYLTPAPLFCTSPVPTQ